METLTIKTLLGESKLLMGESITNLAKYLPDSKIAIITDANIRKYYSQYFPANSIVIEIGLGEENKTLDTVKYIYEQLIENEFDRSSFIVGFGGGIVCDITGYAATTYMRGVNFGFVSTTLLSQVDASIGGKNGVNLNKYKNMIGTFSQPDWVICDFEVFKTLPRQEFVAGFAEIIKHGAIQNAELFSYLEQYYTAALNYDTAALHKCVYESLVIKSNVVNRDEKEKGDRKMLNFGHTIGHAIENLTGVIHGEAVAVGMVLAAELSVRRKTLSREDADRIIALIKKFNLPTQINFDKKALVEAIKKDKKREKENVTFVLLNGIGNIQFVPIAIKQLEEVINDLC